MPTRVYPFIDIAVLAAVRPHFLAGDAVVILSTELDTVVWANGAGAALLGYDDIEEARGAASNLGFAARRQIAGMPGFPAIGTRRSLLVRITQRLSSHTVGFLASEIVLPDGTHAIMLVAPDLDAARRSPEEIGARAIHGIGEAGHHAALIDGGGVAIAASPGFLSIAPGHAALAELVADVRGEADRLIKRLVPIGDMAFPVGVAYLSDHPERHLVVVVDDPQPLESSEPEVAGARPQPAPPAIEPALPAPLASFSGEVDGWFFDDAPRPAPPSTVALDAAAAAQAPTADVPEPDFAAIASDPTASQEVSATADTESASEESSDIAARFLVDEDFEDSTEDDASASPPIEIGSNDLGGTVTTAEEEAKDDLASSEEVGPPEISPEASAAPVDTEPTSEMAGDVAASAPDGEDIDDMVEDVESAVPAEDLIHLATNDATAEAEPAAEQDLSDTAFSEDVLPPPADSAVETDEETPPVATSEPDVGDDAVFHPDLRSGPVRFVWRTDAEGRFASISEEFARSVGPASADVTGRPFREVADAFGLDPDGEIAGLLERRDTWSGRSVMWPIEGTDLKVPVDLAALPVYARDRSFEGFRGFGVVRAGDAVVDEEAIGLSLGTRHDTQASKAVPAEANDPFAGEAPAIAVDATPERRQTDKVIRLAEHRPLAGERTLSPNEKNAFREIGARLKEAGAEPLAGSENPEATPASTEQSPPPDGDEDDQPEPRLYSDDLAGPDEDEWYDDAPDEADGDGLIEDYLDPSEPEPDELVHALGGLDDLDRAADGDEDFQDELPAELSADTDEYSLAAVEYEHAGREEDGEARSVDTSVLERLPVPVLIHSGDTLHFANREFLDLTGYVSLLELEQSGGLDVLFADESESPGRDPDDHRRRLRTRGGEEFPVDALLQSVPWNGGKALLLALRTSPVATVPPATAEELTELESRVNEMSTILDTATDGIVIIGNDGTIRSISRPAEALFGFDSTEVAGKPFVSLFAVESQRAARDYLNGLSDNGVASVLNDGREVIGREAQGRFIPLFMTIGRLPGAKGYCAVLRDITQWKRAEEELTQARAEAERASSQKTEFLARISHEIRTPLNAIIGFSELMIDEKFGPIVNDRYRDYLRDINKSGNHVLDLVNDLLDISKIEAGEQEMSYEAVSLNETLAEAVAMMQPQANRNRVIIRSSYASRLPDVVADLRSIRQIALNLLSNAVRYTQAGGQVIVSTAYEPTGDVVLRVRDTGVGMSQGEIEQALKPFRQINALKRPRGDGTGLGLPLTKAMVEANRARFAISSAPGEGTMVEIVFPSQRVLAG
ncbi:MAG: PAS domain S-box protein [Mesorhizobium sp.]|nr:PAS domain S-box protein [Mesorhizobium sp.]MCO5160362.1 PAS domain S-box protein [Mesorhizobium sp.]